MFILVPILGGLSFTCSSFAFVAADDSARKTLRGSSGPPSSFVNTCPEASVVPMKVHSYFISVPHLSA
jgi:hypothetical protein